VHSTAVATRARKSASDSPDPESPDPESLSAEAIAGGATACGQEVRTRRCGRCCDESFPFGLDAPERRVDVGGVGVVAEEVPVGSHCRDRRGARPMNGSSTTSPA
jgi:hypothetical protein